MGANTTASGGASTAMGSGTTAGGLASTAMGQNTTASGEASTAMGVGATASGLRSIAMGSGPTASGNFSVAIGSVVTASGQRSVAMGTLASTNLRQGSFVYGDLSTSASGALVQATADNSFVVRASGGLRFRTSPDLTTGCDISGGTVPGNLSCTGTIQSASGGFRFPDNTVQTTAATGGISAHEIVQNTCTVPVAGTNECLANCPTGKTILGGGVFVDRGSASIFRTNPEGGVRWRGGVRAGTDAAAQMTTFAICAIVG